MLMRQYFIVEYNNNFSDEFFDYVAGPFSYDDAHAYMHTHRQIIVKTYGYKLVYRDIEVSL